MTASETGRCCRPRRRRGTARGDMYAGVPATRRLPDMLAGSITSAMPVSASSGQSARPSRRSEGYVQVDDAGVVGGLQRVGDAAHHPRGGHQVERAADGRRPVAQRSRGPAASRCRRRRLLRRSSGPSSKLGWNSRDSRRAS